LVFAAPPVIDAARVIAVRHSAFLILHSALQRVSACEADGPGANPGFLTNFGVTNLAILR
jgi:hypothetical protein